MLFSRFLHIKKTDSGEYRDSLYDLIVKHTHTGLGAYTHCTASYCVLLHSTGFSMLLEMSLSRREATGADEGEERERCPQGKRREEQVRGAHKHNWG